MNQHTLPVPHRRTSPGIETKRLLLSLGTACLVASLGAGTALIWRTLGPDGQFALMLTVTAGFLVAVPLLRRLPATGESMAVVGLAGMVVDAIAGRTLHLSIGNGVPLHVYVSIAALAIGVASAAVAAAAPWVSTPLAGAAVVPTIAFAAWLEPTTLTRAALLAPVSVVFGIVIERVLAPLGRRALLARHASAGVAAAGAFIGVAAAAEAAYWHQPAAWLGVLASLLMFAVPELCDVDRNSDAVPVFAATSGVGLAAVAIPAAAHVGSDWRLAAVALLPVAVAVTSLVPQQGLWRRLRVSFVAIAAPTAMAAFLSLHGSEASYVAANAALAAVSFALSVAGPGEVRLGAGIAASAFGTVAAALALDMAHVHVVEAYVATPAVWWTALGIAEMRRESRLASTVLLPGLLVGTVPSLSLALRPDMPREVVLLLVAAAIVLTGAQLRWVAPMAVGAGIIVVLLLRIVGPELVQLPRWLTLAVVGGILLTLGATWERRLDDLHRFSAAARPRIAALR